MGNLLEAEVIERVGDTSFVGTGSKGKQRFELDEDVPLSDRH